MIKINVNKEDAGERIDKFLTNLLIEEENFSRSFVQKLISEGNAQVNGVKVSSNYSLQENDELIFEVPQPIALDLKPENIEFDIVYEDDDIVVINKPNNLVVHPGAGNETGTLVNGLLYKIKNLSAISGIVRPGIVHRLDKCTTGLMIVAKNDISHRKLVDMLKNSEIKKIYHGIVRGVISESKGKIDMPIGRSQIDRKKMAATHKNSKRAVTNFVVLKRFDMYTYVEFDIETGRTHQIRVHMSAINHPILGDHLYGTKDDKEEEFGQFLHSYQLEFNHPITNQKMFFKCDEPNVFIDKIKELES